MAQNNEATEDPGVQPESADPPEIDIEAFLGEPTHALPDWRLLWRRDLAFPVESHRPGLVGRLVVALKKLLRPAVRAPQADLWDRQGVFNQVIISHLEDLHRSFDEIGQDLQTVQTEILRDLRSVQSEYIRDATNLVERIEPLEEFKRKGMTEIMLHTDALFSRVDQKLDRVRRQAAGLRERLEDAEPPSADPG